MCYQLVIYQDEKQWIANRLKQMVAEHGNHFAYYLKSTGMQHVNLKNILECGVNIKLDTLFAILGSVEGSLPNLINIPQLQHTIPDLSNEIAKVKQYYESLKIRK